MSLTSFLEPSQTLENDYAKGSQNRRCAGGGSCLPRLFLIKRTARSKALPLTFYCDLPPSSLAQTPCHNHGLLNEATSDTNTAGSPTLSSTFRRVVKGHHVALHTVPNDLH
jgi:hypothetical protein